MAAAYLYADGGPLPREILLAQRIAQWQQGHDRKSLMDYLENQLAEWFVSHVNIRDFVTARHIATEQQAK